MGKISDLGKKTVLFLGNKHNFALCYIVFLLLRSVFYLQAAADLACKVCFLWGAVLVLVELWKQKKNWFRVQNSIFPLLLCAAFCVSILLNFRLALFGGIKNLIYLAVYLFVLFSVDLKDGKEDFFRRLIRTGDVMLAVNLLICIASLITFLLGITTTYELGTDVYKVGFWYNRLNGVSNCNMATMMGLISVVLSLMNLRILGKVSRGRKALYLTHAILQFIYYALSGSRAATICYALVIVFFLVFDAFRRLRQKKGTVFAAVALTLAFVALVFAEPYLVRGTQLTMKGAAVGVDYVCGAAEEMLGIEDGDGEEDDLLDMEFDRVEDFEGGDTSNGRMDMWLGAFAVVRQHPVFGVADARVMDGDGNIRSDIDASLLSEREKVGLSIGNTYYHNGLIQILVCGGAVFLALFVLFGAKYVWYFLSYLVGQRKSFEKKEYQVILFLFLVLIAVFADNLVESHFLFSGPNGVSVMFWYYIGCGAALIRRERLENKEICHE